MLPLGNLLERFKNLTNTEKSKKQAVVEILLNNSIPSKVEEISFMKNTLYIKTKPIIKTEIALKKDYLIKEVKKIPGLKNISVIQ